MESNVYLLYGEDTYSLEMFVKKIKKNFGDLVLGINYILLDEAGVDGLIAEASTPAFGFDKKLIIVKNSSLFRKEAKKNASYITVLQEKIGSYIENELTSSVTILFIENDINKIPLVKQIEKVGQVMEFKHLTEAQIKMKLSQIAKAYKVNISNVELEYFISICGTNMQELINEIRKLIEFVGQNGTITKEPIDKLCIRKTEAVIFDLTDGLGKRDTKLSLKILDDLVYQKEPLQMILIMLYRHFKNLYLVKQCVILNKDIMSNVPSIKMPFLVKKYKEQASRFTNAELESMLNKLLELDLKSKTGLIDLRVGLDSIICNI